MPHVEGVVAALVLVLFAGAFLGNLAASRRRRRPAISVYETIRRRLDEQRDDAGSDRA